MYAIKFCNSADATSYNKAYALHSLSLVRATPNRGGKAAATSHKQNVICKKHKRFLIAHPWAHKKIKILEII
jgi:hypothetical protein